jgi:hypothetical protein
MLRFLPDGWLEALLRPFLMIDPRGGIYFEDMAPDWRFAMFFVFTAVALAARRLAGGLAFEQRQLVIALPVLLYVWTLSIGNGRYFMAGLLLVGPLLVLSLRLLPGTAGFRWAALAVVVGLQGFVMVANHEPNRFGLVRWQHGAAVSLPPSPVRESPAVFITNTPISYSILVPQFHPQSRWANVVGQSDIKPTSREYKPLMAMLASPLPKYSVMPIAFQGVGPDRQPLPIVRQIYGQQLARFGLTLTDAPCYVLPSNVGPGPPDPAMDRGRLRGFWVCPLAYTASAIDAPAAEPILPLRVAQAFAAVEQRCPRFFPPGNSNDRADDILSRRYPTDVALLVDVTDSVFLKYFRAMNATRLGTVDEVRRGTFELPCDKLPGRYHMPWQSE